jgi:hypothetical protein
MVKKWDISRYKAEKAGHTKIQSSFQEKRFKKVGHWAF